MFCTKLWPLKINIFFASQFYKGILDLQWILLEAVYLTHSLNIIMIYLDVCLTKSMVIIRYKIYQDFVMGKQLNLGESVFPSTVCTVS